MFPTPSYEWCISDHLHCSINRRFAQWYYCFRSRPKNFISIDALQNSLHSLYIDASEKVSNRRKKEIGAHSKATNVVEPRFEVIDFALVRRAVDRGHELLYKGFKTLRTEQVHSPLVYSIAKFSETASEKFYATRMIRYSPKLEDTVVPKEILELADHTNVEFETNDSFVNIADDADHKTMDRVCWDGLPDERDRMWHNAEHMYEVVPAMFSEYLDSTKIGLKKPLVNKLQCLLNIS